MGVAGYFPRGLRELRTELRDAVTDMTRKGVAAIEPMGLAEALAQPGERYEI